MRSEDGIMKEKTIPIRMSAELHQTLTEAAEAAGISMAQFMRDASEKEVIRKCRRCRGTGLER